MAYFCRTLERMQTSETSDEMIEPRGGMDELAGRALAPLGLALVAWGLVGAGLGLFMQMREGREGRSVRDGRAGQQGRRFGGLAGSSAKSAPVAHQGGAATASLIERRAEDGRRLARLDHDLRTPLGAIAAALAVIRGAQEEKERALRDDALDVIDRQAHHMHSIAQSLRDLADDMTNESAPRGAAKR